MKKTVKLFAVILSVLMLLSVIPFAALADGDISAVPEASTVFPDIVASRDGSVSEVTIPANTNAYRDYAAMVQFDPLDTTGADYIEFDMYISAATDSKMTIHFCNEGDQPGRSGFKIDKALSVGWNHVILDYNNPTSPYGELDKTAVDWVFWDGVFSTVNSVTVKLANIAFTKGRVKMNNVGDTVIASHEGIIDQKTVPAGVYLNNASLDNVVYFDTLNTAGADTIEFDYYASDDINEILRIFICNRGYDWGRRSFRFQDIKKGWNHVVLSYDLPFDEWPADTFDKSIVNSIFWEEKLSDEKDITFVLANLAFTRVLPEMKSEYFEVASVPGVISEVTVPANTNAYRPYAALTSFAQLDTTEADYAEFDMCVSTDTDSIMRINFGNNGDGPGRNGYEIKGPLKKGWNHVILDYKNPDNPYGELDFSKVNWVFWDGVFSSTEDVTVKLANIQFTKLRPDAEYENIPLVEYPEIDFDLTLENGGTLTDNAGASFTLPADFTNTDVIEFDIYFGEKPENNLTLGAADTFGKSADATLNYELLERGWNHIAIPISDFVNNNGADFANIAKISLSGTMLGNSETSVRVVLTNFACLAKEVQKSEEGYTGKAYGVYDICSQIQVPGGTDISTIAEPVKFPVPVNLNKVNHIEMNIYITAKTSITLNLNATPAEEGEVYSEASATKVLEGLNYGWNRIVLDVADIIASENGWVSYEEFDPSAVTSIYFSGVAATYDCTFAAEDFAFTADLDYEIAKGDYNADGNVNILDLIFVKKQELSEKDEWFANVAEFDTANDGVINAVDFTALKKALFDLI